MDPNQNNQGDDNTGENRQAIFTPQPQVPDTSVAIPESAQASDGSSTHPYFSSHPTQTFNTDAGDIIIRTDEPKAKHNKRPFIIGGIILAAFVVICAVVLAIIAASSNKAPSGSSKTPTLNDAQQYFAKSAGYLLYNDGNERVGDSYDVNRAYQLDYQFEELDDEHYWNNVTNNLRLAIESLENSDNASTDTYQDLLNFLKTQLLNVDFLSQYHNFPTISSDDLLKMVSNDGVSATNTYIDNLYTDLNEELVKTHTPYFENQQNYYHAVANLYETYRANNCVQNGEILVTCSDNVDTSPIGNTQINALAEASSIIEAYTQMLIRRTENNCWIITSSFADLAQDGENGEN